MKQSKKQGQYIVNEWNGQVVLALNTEMMIPENAPVRLTKAVLEELNYERLYRYTGYGKECSGVGREYS